MTITRASALYLPTLRDAPADADAISHRLLVRGGFIRQLAAGLWTFTPLGWKVHRKVEQIVREEMDAIGAQEWLAPVLTPSELWETTGRSEIPEIFRLSDRAGRHFLLPMTHEESFTFHARELQSYRDLPQSWYHFQTKNRDEPRPRGGLIRVREFIMKDSYSFDRDLEGLERSFRAHEAAYHTIFGRCDLEYYAVQAESGMMGGSESIDFLAPAGSGENTLVRCSNGDFAADLEVARARPRAPRFGPPLATPTEIATPGAVSCEDVAALLEVDIAATAKAMPMTLDDGTVVLALVRGDDRLEPAKLAAALGAPSRPSTDEEIRVAFGAEPGSLGPVGFNGSIIADATLGEGQFVTGANRTGFHLRGVEFGRDYRARIADLRQPRQGDFCVHCDGQLTFTPAIELGHIFKLGTRYTVPLNATFLDEDSLEKPLQMGCYGIGLARVMATTVEQRHDEAGICWPRSLAPYDVHVLALPGAETQALEAAEALSDGGAAVLLDDRELRPGQKFADADLIGVPYRVTVGKKTLEDGMVDLRARASGVDRRVGLSTLRGEIFADAEAS